jgi:hypothetical protein
MTFTAPFADIMPVILRKGNHIRRIMCGEYGRYSSHPGGPQ